MSLVNVSWCLLFGFLSVWFYKEVSFYSQKPYTTFHVDSFETTPDSGVVIYSITDTFSNVTLKYLGDTGQFTRGQLLDLTSP